MGGRRDGDGPVRATPGEPAVEDIPLPAESDLGRAVSHPIERTVTLPDGEERTVNVTRARLTPYVPATSAANGTAVIVAPGGGFRMLSVQSEGSWVAEWLRSRGVAAYVLRYRLVDTGPTDDDLTRSLQGIAAGISAGDLAPAETRAAARADAEAAVRVVRRAGATHVGFVGFSAGGIVATDVATTGASDARPDFVAPIYGADVTGCVPADAPPFFSTVCADDDLCLDWCVEAFRAWRRAGRPAELHVYGQGGHGFGLRPQGLPVDGWIDRLGEWMTASGWL